MSRRTRRAEQQPPSPPAAAAEYGAGAAKIVSNPIFYCEDDSTRLRPLDLRCGYDPPAADAKSPTQPPPPPPLPPPPHRVGPAGARPQATFAMSPRRRVLRRAPVKDPFLAAYVACTRSGAGGKNAAVKQQQLEKKKRGESIRGCGIWGKGKKCTGVMSCKNGCAVAAVQVVDAPAAAAAAAAAAQAQVEPVGPTLDLSRPPMLLPATARERALERRREQS